jgi:hypothetical protein
VVKELQDTLHSAAMIVDPLPLGICNIFNEFSTGIPDQLRNELFRRNNFKQRIRAMMTWISSTIMTVPRDLTEGCALIVEMNNNSANRLDGVSAKLVKFCGQNLAPVLVRVFNHHISRVLKDCSYSSRL